MLWSRSQAGYEPGNGRFVMFHSPTVHCVLRLKHPDVCLQHLRQSQVSFHLMARMHSIHMLMCTHTYRQTDRQTDRHTYRQRDRHTDRQTDRQTDTHTQTDRHTHTPDGRSLHVLEAFIGVIACTTESRNLMWICY